MDTVERKRKVSRGNDTPVIAKEELCSKSFTWGIILNFAMAMILAGIVMLLFRLVNYLHGL